MQHLSNPCLLLAATLALLPTLLHAQSVGIGTATPSTKAALEISAADKGLLIPRLTAAQRTAITSPPQGLMVYQTDGTASGGSQTGFWYYAGSPAAWVFLSPAGDNMGNHIATQNINLTDKLLVGGTAASPGSTGLSVSNAGRVGIGTTGPAEALHVIGDVKVGTNLSWSSSGDRFLKFGDGDYVAIGEANADDLMQLHAKTFTFMPSPSGTAANGYTGNVSIGSAATPLTRLSITPSTIEPKITLWDGGSTTSHYGFGISSGQLNYHVGNTGDAHAFFASGKNGNGTELMRILGSGRVGIGTAGPAATFEVRRGTATDGTAAFWGSTRTSHFNYSTAEDTYLRGGKATSNVYLNDNGGNVGIGTTTVPEKLSVAGTARADANTATSAALIGANANTGGYATGVRGTAAGNGYGVLGIAGNGGYGVSGTADGSGGRGVDAFALDGTGVYAETESGYAIQAIVSNTGANNGYAIRAQATDGVGVVTTATTGNALRATANGTVPAAVITQNGSGLALDVTRGAVRTKEVRTPSTGAHNMLATGYGLVSNAFALAVSSSSENFTVTTTPGLPGAYTLTFPHLSGVDLSDAFVIATPVPNAINTTDFVTTSGGANGVIYINTFQGNFNRINGSFKFILFAP
ncbi:hypothetical protein Q5H93_20895 [Hymenobacter sp. ASUV-10]|uniref:T9SS C-terminal target domain-containing protein n=1 Tax=Hymenobacter aranciens TaxID=3063996 RepID=A0ABT9BG34_9BACT|nr:hypothetical protein [Hymenobacter sp. ASUV-10]MDO7877217.1 hypothetical protein [Hymenobacter sp. ASUV-10]